MTHDLEYKRALAPMEQLVAKLCYEISELESEIIRRAVEFNPSTTRPDEKKVIDSLIFVMELKTNELLKINLRVFKTRI